MLNRPDTRRSTTEALLLGKIFDDRANKMSPSHALKGGVRYRYYVSSVVVQGRQGAAGSVKRLSAAETEKLVVDAFRQHICTDRKTLKLTDKELVETGLRRVVIRSHETEVGLADDPESAVAADPGLRDDDGATIPEQAAATIRIALTPQPHRRRREIILPEQAKGPVQPIRGDERFRLLRAIAQGRNWLDDLIDGACPDITDLAKREGKTERTIRMMNSLAFLDPALVKAAAEGRLSRGYGVSRMTDLPMAWPHRWRALGLPQPA